MNRNSARKHTGSMLQLLLPAHCIVCRHPVPQPGICRICTPEVYVPSLKRCAQCFDPMADSCGAICPVCQQLGLPLTRFRWLWNYEPVARDFIRTMKYGPSPRLMKIATDHITRSWPLLDLPSGFNHIVPLPSSRQRLRQRGIWHTERMALALRSQLPSLQNVPVTHLLTLSDRHSAQTDLLSAAERLRNMYKGYRLCPTVNLNNSHVLLLDDVATTGASLVSAACQLRAAGARVVDGLVLARSPSFTSNRYALNRYYRWSVSA